MTGENQGWWHQAACLEYPVEYFQLEQDETDSVNESDFLKGEQVCLDCPVFFQCAADATEEDKKWTMRAAEWPTMFRVKYIQCGKDHDPRPEIERCYECDNEDALKATEMRGKGTKCRNGHDKKAGYKCEVCPSIETTCKKGHPKFKYEQCKQCAADLGRERYLNKESREMIPCGKGHLRPTGFRCNACYNEKRRRSRAEKRRGTVETSPKATAEGVAS